MSYEDEEDEARVYDLSYMGVSDYVDRALKQFSLIRKYPKFFDQYDGMGTYDDAEQVYKKANSHRVMMHRHMKALVASRIERGVSDVFDVTLEEQRLSGGVLFQAYTIGVYYSAFMQMVEQMGNGVYEMTEE